METNQALHKNHKVLLNAYMSGVANQVHCLEGTLKRIGVH